MQHHLRLRIRPAGKERSDVQTAWSFAGEYAGAGGGTDRLSTVAASEADTFASHAIEIGRGLILATVAREVIDSEVVSKDQYEIGLIGGAGTVVDEEQEKGGY